MGATLTPLSVLFNNRLDEPPLKWVDTHSRKASFSTTGTYIKLYLDFKNTSNTDCMFRPSFRAVNEDGITIDEEKSFNIRIDGGEGVRTTCQLSATKKGIDEIESGQVEYILYFMGGWLNSWPSGEMRMKDGKVSKEF